MLSRLITVLYRICEDCILAKDEDSGVSIGSGDLGKSMAVKPPEHDNNIKTRRFSMQRADVIANSNPSMSRRPTNTMTPP
jgi:hypothetical protein